MPKLFQQIRAGSLTAGAVRARTGRSWNDWCKFLDSAGARMMDYGEIAALLKENGLNNYFARTVAIGYQHDRGLRQDDAPTQPGRRVDLRFNKLVPAARPAVCGAWLNPAILARWLPGVTLQIGKSVPPQRLYAEWSGGSEIAVHFYESRGKTRVSLKHRNLPEEETECTRRYWINALDRLRVILTPDA